MQADADRYAGGYSDAYVSDAWERAVDGWVHGGYTLVSGDTRTAVRYTVDPLGEMRVMARRPGQQTAASRYSAVTGRPLLVPQGSPLLYQPPFYQRLHFGGLDSGFDATEHVHDDSLDDDYDDDDDPFFYDGPDDDWSSLPGEWARLTQV